MASAPALNADPNETLPIPVPAGSVVDSTDFQLTISADNVASAQMPPPPTVRQAARPSGGLDLGARKLFQQRLRLCCMIAGLPISFFVVSAATSFIDLFGRETVGWPGLGLSAFTLAFLAVMSMVLVDRRVLVGSRPAAEHDLHGQVAAQVVVAHAQDRAHAAACDLALDAVARALGALGDDAAQERLRGGRAGAEHARRAGRSGLREGDARLAQELQDALVAVEQRAQARRVRRVAAAEGLEVRTRSLAQELDEQAPGLGRTAAGVAHGPEHDSVRAIFRQPSAPVAA